MVDGMTARYLSLKEVGERLHVKNAAAYRLPEPDALIGTTRGWLPKPSTNGTRNVQAEGSAEDGHARKPNKTRKSPSPGLRRRWAMEWN